MGLFSDTKHTHPGIFILESPPRDNGPVFLTCKPNNEKNKLSVCYRGAIMWNIMKADIRNMSFDDVKLYQKQCLKICFK